MNKKEFTKKQLRKQLTTITESTADIKSELQDQVTYIDTMQIQCINTITENYISKKIIKVVDLIGRESYEMKNQPLFYIYDDGTVERRLILE